MQQAVYLPPDIPPVSHERNSKYFNVRYRADSEIHDGGYDGKPYSLEGLEENWLYAIDDGVIYPVSDGSVLEWTVDKASGYLYFVLENDARRVYRTDLHGQNRTLIYESQYGDITFLAYKGNPDWLALIEDGKRCCFYNMKTKILTVLLTPYHAEQFHYYTDKQYIHWSGQLHENEPDVSSMWNTYQYYLQTGIYKKFVIEKNTWVTVHPE